MEDHREGGRTKEKAWRTRERDGKTPERYPMAIEKTTIEMNENHRDSPPTIETKKNHRDRVLQP